MATATTQKLVSVVDMREWLRSNLVDTSMPPADDRREFGRSKSSALGSKTKCRPGQESCRFHQDEVLFGIKMTEYKKWYREVYLHSDHWKELRLKKLVEVNYRCNICGGHGADVHHVEYGNGVYSVTTSMLRVLCRSCHDNVHVRMDSGQITFKKNFDARKKWNRVRTNFGLSQIKTDGKPYTFSGELGASLKRLRGLASYGFDRAGRKKAKWIVCHARRIMRQNRGNLEVLTQTHKQAEKQLSELRERLKAMKHLAACAAERERL